jgi:beta-N-acetylhexosaminidase
VAVRAFITGLSGPVLTDDERAFLRDASPWGIILFRRNIDEPEQIRRLCREAREALGRENAPVLIDQEGGRVQRIGPPHLRAYPRGGVYGALYRRNEVLGVQAALIGAKLMALDLVALGITVDCLPMLDVPTPETDEIIGDRALGPDVDAVSTLGAAQIEGLLSGGVLPVIKHLPGHGRATVDSHKELPRVSASLAELEDRDFVPFRLLASSTPLGMTCHVVFSAIDDSAPATLSAEVIGTIVRGRIGFDGALMTDDISMGALSGGVRERAEAALRAGCDLVLHCNGEMAEMQDVAGASPELSGDALRRTEAALAWTREPAEHDRRALEARYDRLLAQVAAA